MTIKKDIRYIGKARDDKFISKEPHEIAYQKGKKKLGKKTYGKKYKRQAFSGKKPLTKIKRNHTEVIY